MTVTGPAGAASGAAAGVRTAGVDTEEQAALRTSVAALLARRSDSAAVRSAYASEHGYDPALWATLVEQIGAAALSIPEAYGGAGASWVETHLICEEFGRTLTPSPLFGSAVLAAQSVLSAGDDDAAARLLPGIAAGRIAALCWASDTGWSTPGVRAEGATLTGTSHHVLGADLADVLLVIAATSGTVGLFEVPADADGVTITRVPVMDPTRTLCTVGFTEVTGTAISTRVSFPSRLRAAGWAALTADQVGAARASLDATVRFTKERKQFGREIGSFQALKHRMADMYVKAETARSVSYAAASAVATMLDDGDDAAAYAAEIQTAAAKVYCSDALQWITGEAIQLHGGVGITWDYDAHLYFKRAHGDSQLLGQPHELVAALETAAGLPG